ncbi:MAG: Ig-like domain-containing protein [Vicinamibacterales bacterium]
MVRTGGETLTVTGGFTVTEVDTTPPGVLTTSPANGALDLPLNTEVVVELNEPIDRTTVTTGNEGSFILVDAATGAIVPATVSVDAAGRVATLVPSQLLGVSRGFTIFLSSNAFILDTSGNALPRFIFSFGTGFSTDTTGPALVETTPPDGDTGVPLNASVMLRFSRPINPISRQAGLSVTLGGEPVPGTYVFSDANRIVAFTPAGLLAAETLYTVMIGAELRDAAGNGVTNPGSFSFTTGTEADVTAPVIVGTNPIPEDQGVGRNAVVRVRFDEPVNPLTLVLRLHHAATFQTQAASVEVAADRLSATLTPLVPLLPATRYLAGVLAADRAGNLAGANWHFTTGVDADVTPPAVVSQTPADGATGVPVNARVAVRLSEPIDRTSVDANAIVLAPAVAGDVTLAADRVTLVFTPALPLAPATTYLVTTSGLRDVAGNTMTPSGAAFTTSADDTPDMIAPTVTATSPAHGEVDVPVSAPIVITLSEPIRAGAVHDTSVPVFALVGGSFFQIAGTYAVDPAQTQITFTPVAPYPGSTSIWVNVNNDGGIADAAGNPLVFAQAVFTTAATADATAPTVTSITPLDGATGVGLNTTAVLTFSEPLNPLTVHGGTFALFAGPNLLGTQVNRSADNRTVFLTAPLPPSTRITVVATGGVADLSGNQLIDFVSTFTTGPAVDAGSPIIVTQRPGSGATQVPGTTTITLYASEPLDAATAAAALRVSQNGTLVAGDVTITGNGTALQFTPAAPFAAGALVQVFLDATATDVSGNPLQAFFGQFTIAPDTTATAPEPIRINPAQTSGLPRNVVFDLEFNEPLDASTVDASTVRLVDAASVVVASTVSLRGDRTIRLVPSAPLDASAPYAFIVTTGVRDLQGTAMAFDFAFGVTTGDAIDSVPPATAAVTPPAGATNVGINALVRVSFSEPINPLTVSGSTIRVSGGSLTLMPASISFNSTNTEVTITPLEAMPDLTDVSVTIAGVEDWAGNPVAETTTVFATRLGADTVAPTVVETNIANGQANVPVNTVFTIRFSEPMDSQSISAASIAVVDHTTGIAAAAVVSLSADGQTVTLAPTSALSVGRGYSLVVSGQDLAGNLMPFSGFFAHTFSTAFAGDATAPQVVLVSPADDDIAVPTNARIEVLFDEPVQRTSLGQVTLMAGASAVPITPELSNGNRTLSLLPDGLLTVNTLHSVSIASVRDTSGNVQAAPVSASFTTGPGIDLVAPVITAINPAANDERVGTNVVIRVQFSERMNPLSVNSTTFLVFHAATFQIQRATVAIAADRMSATLTPDAPLLPSTRYSAQITATDLVGFLAGGFWTFTTAAAADTTPPAVVFQTPADGSTDVPVNARVVARLSEAIDRTSVNGSTVALTPHVAGIVALAPDRVTLTFTPSAPLATNTAYIVTLGGLRDVTGNTMTPAVAGFTTGGDGTADAIAPIVTNVTPPHGAVGVGVTAPIVITVSEPIRAGAVHDGSVPVFALVGGTTFVQIAASYEVDATSTQITVTPVAPYPGSTSIWVNINNDGAIADAAGNPLAFTQVVFTTEAASDVTAPTVTSVTPLDGATSVGLNATVVLTFSEPLNPASVHGGTVVLFAGSAQLPLLALNRSADNRTVFLTANLPASTEITVVALGGLTDLSGNQLIDFVSTFTTAPAHDAGAPAIVTMRPGNGAAGVPADTIVTLFANEPLDAATVPGALHVSENGVLVGGAVTVTGNGTAVQFTPLVPFAPSALVQVFLFDTATDVSGNPLQVFFGQFSIAHDTTVTAPEAVRVSPPQFTDLPRNSVLEVEFNEPLDPVTVTTATVRLTDGTGTPVDIAVSLRGDRTIRLAPTAPLAETTTYFPVVTAAVRDLQGTSLPSNLSYAISTGTVLDATMPAVTAVTPPDGTADVGINAMIRVSFSEPINPLTIDGATIQVSGGALTLMPASISFNSTNTEVTITPLDAMPGATVMSVTIAGVEDWAGNAVTPLSTFFTTAPGTDTIAPVIVATSFANASGQTDVPVNSVFAVDFSEPMDPQSITSASLSLFDHATFVAVPATVSLSADGRTATLAPLAPLEVSRGYSLVASGGDLAGNLLPFTGFFTYTFTTSSLTDTTGPQVVATNPGDGHTGVARNVRLQALFDEQIDPTSLDGVTLAAGGLLVPVRFELSDANRTLTVTPATPLLADTGYVLTIAVRDTARNAMAAGVVVAFTTGALFDLGLPNVVSLTPAHGATDVPVTASVEAVFDEAINPLTMLGGTMVLRVTNTGASVPATIAVSADYRTFTLTPAVPLDPGTQYTCTLSFGIADRAGNFLGAPAATTFTTQP